MGKPLVSIVIPVYNGSDYMREAINSALKQTYTDIEVIVVNDGSRDNGMTDTIAKSYGKKIRYFSQDNGGVSSALNLGIEKMHGKYFSWLSHDDVYEPNKIEKQVALLEALDEHTIICSACSYINENSEKMKGHFPDNGFHEGYTDGKRTLQIMLSHSAVNGCSLLIPKSAFDKCGGFDESLRFCQDVFMWYKLFLNNFSMYYTEECLVKSRIHSNQLTQRGQKLFRREWNEISEYVMQQFAESSDRECNLLKEYLLYSAKYLPYKRVSQIIVLAKSRDLISEFVCIKAYVLCNYGIIRPYVRKIYYWCVRKIRTH